MTKTYDLKLYEAAIVADSVAEHTGHRLTTMLVSMPRIVLAEFNTHRVFSRNSASSRAIPVERRIELIEKDPYVPLAFGKNKKGMQASENLESVEAREAEAVWRFACEDAIRSARQLAKLGVHKQLANRLLEAFSPHVVLVSSTEWDNFFNLRDHPDAQPEIQLVARAMKKALAESTPKVVKYGEWHLPFYDESQDGDLRGDLIGLDINSREFVIRCSAGRCARLSYLTHDGKRDPTADYMLCTDLIRRGHMSPMEHPATPGKVDYPGKGNFRGWTQFRSLLPNEAVFQPKEG